MKIERKATVDVYSDMDTHGQTETDRFAQARVTYNYCGICGHVPRDSDSEPNKAPLRWWDPDDGWKIGSLCRNCWEDYGNTKPKATDFAMVTASTNHVCDDCNTDEDPIEAL